MEVSAVGEFPQRRQYPRFPLVLRVDYPDRANPLGEWTENVSAGGVFVRTEQTFDVGENVEIAISFPGLLDPIRVVGRIAWVRESGPIQPGGIGVEVVNDGARRRLADISLRAGAIGTRAHDSPFRVLVVEDNLRVVRSYERVLAHVSTASRHQVEIHFVQHGQEALESIAKQSVDLLITDIYMPVMDGFTLIAKIRADPATATLPIIVITGGRADEGDRAHALGVNAFLRKPVQFGQLLETIACLFALEHAPQ